MAFFEIFLILRTESDEIVSACNLTGLGLTFSAWENNGRDRTITRNTTSNRFSLKRYNFNIIFV
jgi:hypothetical protein